MYHPLADSQAVIPLTLSKNIYLALKGYLTQTYRLTITLAIGDLGANKNIKAIPKNLNEKPKCHGIIGEIVFSKGPRIFAKDRIIRDSERFK